jgi:hypothetical protein
MSSVPFAIRLSTKLVALLEAFAEKTGISERDAVRAAIEQSVSNEYRILLMDRLSHKEQTIKRVRDFLNPKQGQERPTLEALDYSALMCYWHWAYMHAKDGYANPTYVGALLEITLDLIRQTNDEQLKVHEHYLRSKLDLEPNESFEAGIARVKNKFRGSPNISYAEWLTRPLEAMSSDLNQYEVSKLHEIFVPHLQTLFPLSILGAEASIDETVISQDMQPLLPTAEVCRIGGLVITLYAAPSLALVVSGENHAYAFSADSVLSIATAIDNRVFDDLISKKIVDGFRISEFKRKSFCVLCIDDQITIHEQAGYRLNMNLADFSKLADMLRNTLQKSSWGWLINRYRNLGGDI